MYASHLFRDGTDGLAYLLKDRIGDLDHLLAALQAVVDGQSLIDPQVVESFLARGKVARRTELDDLTEREGDVLREMAQGKSNLAISRALHVSESAVEKHVSAIFWKLGLGSVDAAINRRVAAVIAYLDTATPGVE
jgi:DNA-binding NarL/FixJ family response regulator